MDIVTRTTLETLTAPRRGPCCTIYLPTHRMGAETRQDPIRLDNLIDRVREEMMETGIRRPDADGVLQPAVDLTEQHEFWQHQEDGLALFLGQDLDGGMLALRLPVSFDEFVVTGDSFHIKPLLQTMSRGEQFHVLALSQNEVRLFGGTRHRVTEVDLPAEVPKSLADALWFEDRESQLQLHQADRVAGGVRGGRPTATFHGHGVTEQHDRRDIARFFRAVDEGVRRLVHPGTPVVLAGVAYLLPIYREIAELDSIVPGGIEGNPERSSADELHERARAILAPRFDEERRSARSVFESRTEPTLSTLEEAVPAARDGRIDTVFVPMDDEAWGTVSDAAVERHDARKPGDRDLFDLVAADTLDNSGTVFTARDGGIPGGGEVAAILRY